METFLVNNPFLSLLLIISIGYLVGNIKLKGVSLGSSAILFVGLYAGSIGVEFPKILKILGLAFFIYSIGIQAGAKLRGFFKKETLVLNLIAFMIVAVGAVLSILGVVILGYKPALSIGIFAGALTSTPGLAAAEEATGSSLASVGYSIAYPFGVIGVIIFIKIIQMLYSTAIKDEENKEKELSEAQKTNLTSREIKVTNPGVCGKSLMELKIPESFSCIISRLMRDEKEIIPSKNTILKKGDIVRVVGREEDIERVAIFLGEFSKEKIQERLLTVMNFIVTNKEIVGKTIRELKLKCSFNANITRVKRSGIDIPALASLRLEWGDRVTVVGEKASFEHFKKLFGDDVRKVDEANVFSIILGLAIGILVGALPVSFGHFLSFKLGITGGVLISGLLFSNIKKIGPILFIAPSNIVNFIRELGLVFFLSAVGVSSGKIFGTIIKTKGTGIILWGACTTIIPMVIAFFVSRYIFKVEILKLLGLIPAGMTSTPGFGAAQSSTESETPSIVYATVYPFAMLSMIVWAKILAEIL